MNCPESERGTHATATHRCVSDTPSGCRVATATGLAGSPLACSCARADISNTAIQQQEEEKGEARSIGGQEIKAGG